MSIDFWCGVFSGASALGALFSCVGIWKSVQKLKAK